MLIRLILVITLLCTNSAVALSCAQISQEALFNTYADAPESYILALGVFKEAEPDQVSDTHQVQMFNGHSLASDPTQDTELDVAVKSVWPDYGPELPQIAGDDRGPPVVGARMLVFLQIAHDQMIYQEQLCLPVATLNPAPELVALYRSCLARGRCE